MTCDANLAMDFFVKSQESFTVQRTTIEGCDFHGLFTNRPFSKGEILCKYTGRILRTTDALKLEDKSYLMRLGEQCYVDAREYLEVKARLEYEQVKCMISKD